MPFGTHTKILATIGPSTATKAKLAELIEKECQIKIIFVKFAFQLFFVILFEMQRLHQKNGR